MSDRNQTKIISARDWKEVDPAGKVNTFAIYEYTLGDLGPFIVKTPTAEDSPEKLKAAIDAKRAILEAQG